MDIELREGLTLEICKHIRKQYDREFKVMVAEPSKSRSDLSVHAKELEISPKKITGLLVKYQKFMRIVKAYIEIPGLQRN